MTAHARYRVENGRWCIDIEVSQSRQLFDFRDPAPFRERDLDDDAVEYLLSAAEEIPRKHPLPIVVTISEEPEPRLEADAIAAAIRTHFLYEFDQVQRRLREHMRRGQMSLVAGLTILVAFLTLAEFILTFPSSTLRGILREGFVITGWVAMWRPLEILLYDWWPMVDERRHIVRVLDAPVSIRYGTSVVQGPMIGLSSADASERLAGLGRMPCLSLRSPHSTGR